MLYKLFFSCTLSFFFFQSSLLAQKLTPVSLQLLWKYQFQFAGYIIAKEKGFYQDEGLDVKLREFEVGKLPMDEVARGGADFGIGGAEVLLKTLNKDYQFVHLFALCQASPLILQTVEGNGITKLSDIKGKKLLIYDYEDIASLTSMYHSVGVKRSDLKLVMAKTYGLEEIVNGSADMVEGYSTITPYMIQKMGYKPITFHPKDYGFDFYGDILFANDSFIKKNPTITAKFYKASLKGWEYAFTNIEETIKLIEAKYNTQKLEHDALTFEANEYKKLAFFPNVPFGNINPLKLEKIANSYRLLGVTKNTQTDFKTFIYSTENEKDGLFNLSEKEFIKNNPIVRIGIRTDLKPISFINETGLHSGILNDILQFISQKSGIHFIYVDLKKEDLLTQLASQKVDMILSQEEIDTPNILFTKPFFSLRNIDDIKNLVDDSAVKNLDSKNSDMLFAFHNDSSTLQNIILKTLEQLTIEQKDAIHNKWLPQVVEKKIDWIVIVSLLLFFTIVIIFLLFMNLQQKRKEKERLDSEVAKKTKELKSLADEKTLLFKELNHRVKNNLQMILSLLRLQNDKTTNNQCKTTIETIENRVNAISYLHEILYKQDTITHIDTNGYFQGIINGLLENFQGDVEVFFDIECNIPSEQAIYCGIILNEIVTNSLKYAFGENKGEIKIHVSKNEFDYTMIVEDNGVGFEQKRQLDSLGMILIEKLASKQLQGTLEVRATQGTNTKIQWRENDK